MEKNKNISFFRFPSNNDDKKNIKYIFMGIPFDHGTTQNWGSTNDAPTLIRELSDYISLLTERNIYFNEDVRLLDVGNVLINPNLKSKQDFEIIKELIDKITNKLNNFYKKTKNKNLNEQIIIANNNVNQNIIPIFIGGNHLITYSIIKSLNNIVNFLSSNNVAIISLDAHLDFYEDWEGKKFLHCTVMKRIFELLKEYSNDNLIILGTRDIDIPEYENAKANNFSNYLNTWEIFKLSKENNKSVSEIMFQFIKNKIDNSRKHEEHNKNNNKEISKVYISIDIDVLDPSVAPATGYPIPGGLSYRDILNLIEKLINNYDILGIDLVEYMPNLDLPNKMTGFLCTRLIQEIIGFLELKNKKD
ncbi:MAG: arginase family protein [Promethearchaeota archaeon]